MTSQQPTVCFFGIYDPEYSRNAILMDGFRQDGFEVVECRVSRTIPKFKKWWALYQEYRKLPRKDFDVVIVAYPAQVIVPLARILFGKRIVADLFVSLFDSNVGDRKRWSIYSLRGIFDFLYDFLACQLAGRVLTDTELNLRYFQKTFFMNPDKGTCVPVGATTRYLHKIVRSSGLAQTLRVHFHGNYIPLQGVPYIVKAAKLLEDADIFFTLIGGGQTYKEAVALAEGLGIKNIAFTEHMSMQKLNDALNSADIVLGIFGDTDKAMRVVPNKVYEGMAVGASIITADTPAIREIFGDEAEHCFTLVPAADEKALAEAIELLKENPDVRAARAEYAHNYFQAHLQPEDIVGTMLTDLGLKHKTVIYTAIFGKKDILEDPKYIPEHVDFVCFTDQLFVSRVWQVRHVAQPVADDPGRSNRYYKMLAHRFLPEYEQSIYIDGNVHIVGDITVLIDTYLADANFAAFSRAHYARLPAATVEDEMKLLLRPGQDIRSNESFENIRRQFESYAQEGFPDTLPLICGGILIRRHMQQDVIDAMETWWHEVSTKSRRDQMSFTYSAWKTGFRFNTIPLDAAHNEYTEIVRHFTPLSGRFLARGRALWRRIFKK